MTQFFYYFQKKDGELSTALSNNKSPDEIVREIRSSGGFPVMLYRCEDYDKPVYYPLIPNPSLPLPQTFEFDFFNKRKGQNKLLAGILKSKVAFEDSLFAELDEQTAKLDNAEEEPPYKELASTFKKISEGYKPQYGRVKKELARLIEDNKIEGQIGFFKFEVDSKSLIQYLTSKLRDKIFSSLDLYDLSDEKREKRFKDYVEEPEKARNERYLSCPLIPLDDNFVPSEKLKNVFIGDPIYGILPYKLEDDILIVFSSDPYTGSLETLEDLLQHKVVVARCSDNPEENAKRIARIIKKVYTPNSEEQTTIDELMTVMRRVPEEQSSHVPDLWYDNETRNTRALEFIEENRIVGDEPSPILRLCSLIVAECVREGSNGFIVEATEKDCIVYGLRDKTKYELMAPPRRLVSPIVNTFSVAAGNHPERIPPIENDVWYTSRRGKKIVLSVKSNFTNYGERVEVSWKQNP